MDKAASRIIYYVGGKDNISYFARCMSRLRFVFKDVRKINLTELKKMREIISIVRCGEEICFVIKKELPYLYMAISEKLDVDYTSARSNGVNEYIKCYKYILVLSEILCIISFLLQIKGIMFATFFITTILSFFTGVIADILLGLVKDKNEEENSVGIEIWSPFSGIVVETSGDEREYFRIYPHSNIAVSPIDGVVEDICGHAFLIRSSMGFGVFVHIGVDTVNARECFDTYVKRGDLVKRGNAIVEFNDKKLKEKGYSLLSYVEILDHNEKWSITVSERYATRERTFVKLMEK